MNAERRRPLRYLAAVSAAFLVCYLILGVRELGLAVLMIVLNHPASVLTLPFSEHLADLYDVAAGSAAHVWATQGATMAVNALLLYASIRAVHRVTDR